MEIEELTMEQAKEYFYSPQGQQMWAIALRLVGPPADYSFKDDYRMRLSLCAALSGMLIRKDERIAKAALDFLKAGCVTNFDKAVWALTAGTFPEVFGNKQDALNFYEDAIDKYARTYVAYLRMAKIAYDAEDFKTAEAHCRKGLACLNEDELYEKSILKDIESQFITFLDEIRKKNAPIEPPKWQEPEILPLEEILAIEDTERFVMELTHYIGNKCDYGDDMSTLSKPERIFYITQILEMEVNNGGFSQFFFNSSGDFANEIVDAYSEIGAVHMVEICKKAVAIFGETVPADRDERDDIMDNDEFEEILNACDDAFYEYEDNLNTLNHEYVMKYKAFFT